MSGIIINRVAGVTTRLDAPTVTISADDVMVARTPELRSVVDGRPALAVNADPGDAIGGFNHADCWDRAASYGPPQSMVQRPIYGVGANGRPFLQFGFGGTLGATVTTSGAMRAASATSRQLPAAQDYTIDLIATAQPGTGGAWVGGSNRDADQPYFVFGFNGVGQLILRHGGLIAGTFLTGSNADMRNAGVRHLRACYSHANTRARLYLDGVLVGTKSDMPAGIAAGDAPQRMVIGGTCAGVGTANDLLQGQIYRMILCGVDLSEDAHAVQAAALRSSAVTLFGCPA